MTERDIKYIREYLENYDEGNIVKISFTLETMIGGVGHDYILTCDGPILGSTRRRDKAIELIDACLGITDEEELDD